MRSAVSDVFTFSLNWIAGLPDLATRPLVTSYIFGWFAAVDSVAS